MEKGLEEKYTKMLKLACLRWLWFVSDHFLFLFSQFYLMDDSISQNPAGNRWHILRIFIKGTFLKKKVEAELSNGSQ